MHPRQRPRRLRRTPALRSLVRETGLGPGDLVLPFFVVEGEGVERPIPSMPGLAQLSVDGLIERASEAHDLGVGAVLLFGVPDHKDAAGSSAWDEDGVVQRATRELKRRAPKMLVITDVCLCEYTDHGHCGVLEGGEVVNDATVELLARQATSHANAGADIVAPSDMMDGRVGALRDALDRASHSNVAIMSYAVKYASAFYGPFREAAGSAPKSGDRRGYQMDPGNAREALREARLDVKEGADILMVKPAMPCLDIVRSVRAAVDSPVAAYQVSGEYAMIRAASERGWIDEEAAVMESLLAIKRAGADIIVTYFASKVARWLNRR